MRRTLPTSIEAMPSGSAVADGQLGRAAADVEHEEGPVLRVEAGGGAGEGEPGLLLAGEHLDRHAEDRLPPRRGTASRLADVAQRPAVPTARTRVAPCASRTSR